MAITADFPLAHRRNAATGLDFRLPGLTEPRVVFGLCLALYVVVAAVLVFVGNVLAGDGVSRVAIANRILFSRDPHLAAIGFVWSPLPNLVLLPLVPLKFLWPPLVRQAFAGNLVSSLFMAGAVYQFLRFLQDIGMARARRLALTACFAFHPMIVLYAANSMSEAQLLFFLLLVVRHLGQWLRERSVGSLVATGMYLALAYLTRYEATAAAAAVLGVVGVATYFGSRGAARSRLALAAADCMIAITPFAFAFAFWALVSLAITGTAFQQFSSPYGNTAQLHAMGVASPTPAQELDGAGLGVRWMLALEPFLPLVLVIGAIRSIFRRDLNSVALPAVLAAVVTFMFWAHSTGTIFHELRYFIVAIPFALVVLAVTLAPAQPPYRAGLRVREESHAAVRSRRDSAATSRIDAPAPVAFATGCILLMACAIPSGANAILSNSTNPDQAFQLQALLTRMPTREQQMASKRWLTERSVSSYIDSRHLPKSSILIDDFVGFVIVMTSDHPNQYVITTDRDFLLTLSAPAEFGIRYILVPPNRGRGSLDAINRQYPTLYDDGAGIGTMLKQFPDASDLQMDWRLYRVGAQQ